MHQAYLILRNNKERGPYSLEELLSLSLQPADLIWVEGQSISWSYPSEVEALKPYVQPPESFVENKRSFNTGKAYFQYPKKEEEKKKSPTNNLIAA